MFEKAVADCPAVFQGRPVHPFSRGGTSVGNNVKDAKEGIFSP